MNFKNCLILFFLVSFLVSCSLGPSRQSGTCFMSEKHGGPYLLLDQNSQGLLFRDPLRKSSEIGPFENDESWQELSCPF